MKEKFLTAEQMNIHIKLKNSKVSIIVKLSAFN